MEASSLGSIVLCAVPLIAKYIKRKRAQKKDKISAVVIPRYCGKSSFINEVSSEKYLLFDLEANVNFKMTDNERNQLESMKANSSYRLHYYPICKKYFEEVKINHKDKNIIIFCSDVDLVHYCGINNIHAFVPSSKFCKDVKALMNSDECRSLFESNKLEILTKIKQKYLHVYDSFSGLHEGIFKLYPNITVKL